MGDVGERPAPTRGPWIVAGAIVVAAIIVVVALVVLKDDPCGAWQKDIRALAERVNEWAGDNPNLSQYSPEQQAYAAEAQVLLDDYERAKDDRPAGCAYPED